MKNLSIEQFINNFNPNEEYILASFIFKFI